MRQDKDNSKRFSKLKIVKTNLALSFIQFRNYLVAEIWVDNDHKEKYEGEILISMN